MGTEIIFLLLPLIPFHFAWILYSQSRPGHRVRVFAIATILVASIGGWVWWLGVARDAVTMLCILYLLLFLPLLLLRGLYRGLRHVLTLDPERPPEP